MSAASVLSAAVVRAARPSPSRMVRFTVTNKTKASSVLASAGDKSARSFYRERISRHPEALTVPPSIAFRPASFTCVQRRGRRLRWRDVGACERRPVHGPRARLLYAWRCTGTASGQSMRLSTRPRTL
jgi:hypothetical protein